MIVAVWTHHYNNKKVLLPKCKRHTTRHIASVCYAVTTGGYIIPVLARGYHIQSWLGCQGVPFPVLPGEGVPTWDWGISRKDMAPVEELWDGDGVPSKKNMGSVEVLWDGDRVPPTEKTWGLCKYYGMEIGYLCEWKDACENITFPILRLRAVKRKRPVRNKTAETKANATHTLKIHIRWEFSPCYNRIIIDK